MNTMEIKGYREIGRKSDFPRGLGMAVRIGSLDLAVFHTTGGELFALENRTPHPKGGTLAEAIVSGRYIYCPLRDLKIDLASGQVQKPDTGCALTYHVIVDGERVYIATDRI